MSTAKPTYSGGRAFGALLEISHAHHEQRAPSARAVAVLAEAFERWLAEDAHWTFDQVLGFAAGRGKAPYLEKLRDRLRDLFICHLMAICHAEGFSVGDAAELVSAIVNGSKDTRFRKQCRELKINPPAAQRERKGEKIEHLPAKSVRRIYEGRGGEKWARCAGYFGDCEERRTVAKLYLADLDDPGCQENLQYLHDFQCCRGFPFRSLDELRQIAPLDRLAPDLADRLRGK